MKTIGIYVGPYIGGHWDGTNVKNGMGGSETWAYEVAMRLPQYGFDVTMYADPETDHDPCKNFHLVSYEKFWYDSLHREFDYFIFSRVASADVIHPYLRCHNVFAMAHDVCMITPSNLEDHISVSRIKKIGYLSEWHKENLLNLYSEIGVTEAMLYKVTNGYSSEYYNKIDFAKKTKSMVWSSSLLRGFEDFYEYVALPIIKEIPDFTIYVCCGTLFNQDMEKLERVEYLPNVKVLYKLSKEQLAEYQKQARIWVYPGVFPETFCITAVENANAGNVIISPLSYGLDNTLENIDYLREWNLPILNEETAPQYVEKALKVLNDDEYCASIALQCLNGCKQYNWDRATQEIVDMITNDNMTYMDLYNRAAYMNSVKPIVCIK